MNARIHHLVFYRDIVYCILDIIQQVYVYRDGHLRNVASGAISLVGRVTCPN